MSDVHAAVDLGTESGRVVVGRLDQGRVSLREVHRFANRTKRVESTLRWDLERLLGEVLAGLGAAAKVFPELASVAIDAWGMDFGLLDARGRMLGAPFHHGDQRTEGISARLHSRVPEEELWATTGVQPERSNTLHQLFAMVRRRSSTLSRAARLLLIPDLLAYRLCGTQVAEHTVASTTQCYDHERRAWLSPLLSRVGIPVHLLPPVVPSGTSLGRVQGAAARRAGLAGVDVVAPACHRTASAVAAIAPDAPSFAFIVAGALSEVGAVAEAPVKAEVAWTLSFTNGGGADGTTNLYRTMAGLRLVHECHRAWRHRGEVLDDDALTALAATGKRFLAVVDPDDPSLAGTDDVFAALLACAARLGHEISGTRADLLRMVLESLAWKYRRSVRELEALLGRRLDAVHVVGEGARNALLCQLTADACGRPVLAGPVEAAALGNVLAQAVAAGTCQSWAEARLVARSSVTPVRYEPQDAAAWDEASARMEPALGGDQVDGGSLQ
ncbi:MAG TPA: FGGY family carbohydrate kinase [Anaeromyxobacter sp.]|nr:FGGY family carbohydrate kinase [Anaeromyxobacter sp.]